MNSQDNVGTANTVMSNDRTIECSNLNSHQSSLPMPLPSNNAPLEEEANASSSLSHANGSDLIPKEISSYASSTDNESPVPTSNAEPKLHS